MKVVANRKELKKALNSDAPFIITNKALSIRTNLLKDSLDSIFPKSEKYVKKDDKGNKYFIVTALLKLLKKVLTTLLSAAVIILIIFLGGYALFYLTNKFEYVAEIETEIDIPEIGKVKGRIYKPKSNSNNLS